MPSRLAIEGDEVVPVTCGHGQVLVTVTALHRWRCPSGCRPGERAVVGEVITLGPGGTLPPPTAP